MLNLQQIFNLDYMEFFDLLIYTFILFFLHCFFLYSQFDPYHKSFKTSSSSLVNNWEKNSKVQSSMRSSIYIYGMIEVDENIPLRQTLETKNTCLNTIVIELSVLSTQMKDFGQKKKNLDERFVIEFTTQNSIKWIAHDN